VHRQLVAKYLPNERAGNGLNALGVQIDPEEPERFPKLQLR
jgi:hypothetical protein